MMKKAAIYARVSTPEQHVETQLYDLRKLAAQRGFEVIREYCDRGVSSSKVRRPGLDAMMADARRGEFSVLLVAAFDRIARSTKNFLEIVDELNSVNIEFVSAREAIDTSGPMGRIFFDDGGLDCRTGTVTNRRAHKSRNASSQDRGTPPRACSPQR
jgi:DNA invertase Pin-like site-specific DNA recombinase